MFGLKSFAFQLVLLGIGSFVFHYWGDRLYVPAATFGFAMVFRRITADRELGRWFGAVTVRIPVSLVV